MKKVVKKACPFIKTCEMHKALRELAGDNIICFDNYPLCRIYKKKSMKRASGFQYPYIPLLF